MNKYIFLILACFSFQIIVAQKAIKQGMRISVSTKIKKGTYPIDAFDSLNKAVIVIEGNNITVDFNNAILKGSNKKKSPDEFFGVGIIVRNGKNITIKNLTAKGYKVALLARNVDGLKLEHCDLSYNYRQHLNSTQEKEDISDWMSYHHNEKDEWLRYGAAMYLRNCNNAVINDCKMTGGQNALMMMECNNALIYNNDFSFNSGIGLGMYLCNNNKVLYNRINFNVRGYSHGVYNRGQDSAGILVYEQSSNNLFYKNSVTHGGDGFFLWAGQTTMDSGKGGCNDNILMDNDFSYAPTNGIEVTFSRNQIIHNRIYECDHGIWGGYSYNSKIANNQFRDNRIAIAIEHGQEDTINHNLFINDKTAVKLWARAEQPADWGYAKNRDTRSRNYVFVANSFYQNNIVYDLQRTDSIIEFGNIYNNCDRIFKRDSTVRNISSEPNDDLMVELSNETNIAIPKVKNPNNPFTGNGKLQGRKNILVTEWGPYNFQYPIIWNTNPTDTPGKMEFDVLGPKGHWKIVSAKGVELDKALTGSFPSHFSAKKLPASTTNIEIVVVYKGPAFVDAFGNKNAINKPYRFAFKKFFQPINFIVSFYAFDSSTNPITKNLLALNQPPFKRDTVKKLDYAWWGGIKAAGKQYPQFFTVAEGTATIPSGNYELSVTWDDAVRVCVDGKIILDEWNPSKYTFDESPNRKIKLKLGGEHKFRIEHVELGGFATLNLKLTKSD
jgi:nitrous oxidase accessory protein NosD